MRNTTKGQVSMKPVESRGPGHELCFERSGWEKRGICKRLPRLAIYLSRTQSRVISSLFYFRHSTCQKPK